MSVKESVVKYSDNKNVKFLPLAEGKVRIRIVECMVVTEEKIVEVLPWDGKRPGYVLLNTQEGSSIIECFVRIFEIQPDLACQIDAYALRPRTQGSIFKAAVKFFRKTTR